jgi:hypothetical protein
MLRQRTIGVLAVALVAGACAAPEPAGPTGLPLTPAASTAAPTTTTLQATTSTRAGLVVEPIEGDWAITNSTWGVQAPCCDQPAIGPPSPAGAIPADRWPADGFYDVTVERLGDPPGVLGMAVRRWVPCAELSGRCAPDPPTDGIVGSPASEVLKTVFMDDALTVVIRSLPPGPTITGSGGALYELLSGFCGGYLPARNPVNCGIDHAFNDWILEPHRAGAGLMEIRGAIVTRDTDPAFPLEQFDDGSSELPCSPDRSCPIAYRAPHGARLVLGPSLVEEADGSAGFRLYGWWTSLEVREGRPILYIDAGQIAG